MFLCCSTANKAPVKRVCSCGHSVLIQAGLFELLSIIATSCDNMINACFHLAERASR